MVAADCGGGTLGLGAVAGSTAGGVGVVGLGGDAAVVLDVVEGAVHEAAVATAVALVAVDELLLGQLDELAGLDLGYALHGGAC